MAEVEQVLRGELELIVKDIIADYDRKKMRASGDFAKSLEVVVETSGDNVKGKILGSPYAEQLNSGRGPTKSKTKGDPTLKERIEQWIKDKGISSDDLEPSALAYIIARSIHMNGWKRTELNLINDVITPQRIQSILNKVGASYTDIITNKIKTELSNLNLK